MNHSLTRVLRALPVVALAAVAGGCENFLEVENPTVIDAGTIDPTEDATTFALSAQTNLFDAFDNLAVYGAWFTGEAYVGETVLQRNEIARRLTVDNNTILASDVYRPLALAIASNERLLELLGSEPEADARVSVARAAMSAGFAIEMMAETFCQGVISSGLHNLGAPLTPAQTAERAVARFQQAIELGTAAGAEAAPIVNAARVGLARAYLQLGSYALAAQTAEQVPAGFVFNVARAADASAQDRLGNTVFYYTLTRPSLVVPPAYRALNDPRVPSALAMVNGQPAKTFGNGLDFHRQTKYTGFATPMRLASGLHARYIVAEAKLKLDDPAAAQALVAERRAAGSAASAPTTGLTGDPLLVELLDQKARDFYLEATLLGDWQRNPTATPFVIPAGSEWYVPGNGAVGSQTCLPIPAEEKLNNPNFPRS